MIDPKLTALEVLGIAIRSEIHAGKVYERLFKMVRNPALRERLQILQGEEEQHRKLLEQLHAKSFPDVELKLPQRSLVPMEVATKEGITVPELIQLAMEAERRSEQFYREMAGRAQEQGHYHLLENERELIERFPDYYKAEHFDLGEEAIHLGP
ncbi:MAG: ferritin family protein [Candidatus Bipolaricaulia bacterium]